MHLLILCLDGKYRVRKRCDIREVAEDHNGDTCIYFNGTKNTPIKVPGTVISFYHNYIKKEHQVELQLAGINQLLTDDEKNIIGMLGHEDNE